MFSMCIRNIVDAKIGCVNKFLTKLKKDCHQNIPVVM
jgi:hypothetical protein